MARIAGVDLPPQKQVWVGLTYIHGIGASRARTILSEAGVEDTVKVKDLTEDEARRIRKIIQDQFRVEGDLRKEVSQNIRRLMEIGSSIFDEKVNWLDYWIRGNEKYIFV